MRVWIGDGARCVCVWGGEGCQGAPAPSRLVHLCWCKLFLWHQGAWRGVGEWGRERHWMTHPWGSGFPRPSLPLPTPPPHPLRSICCQACCRSRRSCQVLVRSIACKLQPTPSHIVMSSLSVSQPEYCLQSWAQLGSWLVNGCCCCCCCCCWTLEVKHAGQDLMAWSAHYRGRWQDDLGRHPPTLRALTQEPLPRPHPGVISPCFPPKIRGNICLDLFINWKIVEENWKHCHQWISIDLKSREYVNIEDVSLLRYSKAPGMTYKYLILTTLYVCNECGHISMLVCSLELSNTGWVSFI